MAHTFKYAILRLTPDARRGESLNVGLVVFNDNGGTTQLDVRMISSPRKVHAIAGTYATSELYSVKEEIATWVSGLSTPEEMNASLRHFGEFSTTDLGFFVSEQEDYEREVTKLLDVFVNAKPARLSLERSSRVQTELKKLFRSKDMLGSSADQIHQHKVIPQFPISADEGLYVDFALKNGVYHLTETVDFRVKTENLHSKLKEAGFSALTLDRARDALGMNIKRIVVYAANAGFENSVAQHLKLLSKSADHVLNYSSPSDRAYYVMEMERASGRSMI